MRFAAALVAFDLVGIDSRFSEQGRDSIIEAILYDSKGTTNIASNEEMPSTNLSGVPLRPNGITVEYRSFYGMMNNDSRGRLSYDGARIPMICP